MPILLPNNLGKNGSVTLSGRLLAIAESLPDGSYVCDVGSDHGLLPQYLLQSKKSSRCIVTDVHQAPLDRAKNNLKIAGVSSQIHFVLTDGIKDVLSFHPDAFVIAGMGGETILQILNDTAGKIDFGTYFVLQPMTKEQILRQYLYENKFRVVSEQIVKENGKLFVIICAVYTGENTQKELDNNFYLLGEFIPLQKNPVTVQYIQNVLQRVELKIDGLKTAGKVSEKEQSMAQYLRDVLGRLL